MTLERVQPGAAWRPPKAVDTNAIAKCVDEWMRAHELGNASRALPITRTSDLVKVKNLTAAARVLGEVVEVGESLLTQTNRLNLTFEGNTPTATGTRFAILRESAADNRIVSAQIAGIVQARVNVTDEAHDSAGTLTDSHVLQSGFGGGWQIWWKPDGVGEFDCMVMFSANANTQIHIRTGPAAGRPEVDANWTHGDIGGVQEIAGVLKLGWNYCELWDTDSDGWLTETLDPVSGYSTPIIVWNKSTVDIPVETHLMASRDRTGLLVAHWMDCP